MSGKSNIEWTQHTWNPFVGCKIHSPGCTNCYAMKDAFRIQSAYEATGKPAHYDGVVKLVGGKPVWTGKVGIAPDKTWLAPLRRKKPTVYFVNSMSDLWFEGVPDGVVDKVLAIMALCPQHIFQVLTKRPDRMWRYLEPFNARRADSLGKKVIELGYDGPLEALSWPLPNVWLGVSTERMQEAAERIPWLLNTPAAVRWISAEPLIGPIDLTDLCNGHFFFDALRGERWHDDPDRVNPRETFPGGAKLDWVVAGGESQNGARPMHPGWVRTLQQQCAAAGVPFFFKQWGVWGPASAEEYAGHPHSGWVTRDGRWSYPQDGAAFMVRFGKGANGAVLDGREYREMPGGIKLAEIEEAA